MYVCMGQRVLYRELLYYFDCLGGIHMYNIVWAMSIIYVTTGAYRECFCSIYWLYKFMLWDSSSYNLSHMPYRYCIAYIRIHTVGLHTESCVSNTSAYFTSTCGVNQTSWHIPVCDVITTFPYWAGKIRSSTVVAWAAPATTEYVCPRLPVCAAGCGMCRSVSL